MTNTYSFPLNYKLYADYEDYCNDRSPVFSGTIAPFQTIQIPWQQIDKHEHYVADFYSDDFIYSNWTNEYPTSATAYRIYFSPNDYRNIDYYPLCKTLYGRWLINEKTEQSWKSINAFKSGVPVWDSLNEHEQYLRVTFKKRFEGDIISKNSNGEIWEMKGRLLVIQDTGRAVLRSVAAAYNYLNTTTKHTLDFSPTRDTISFDLYDEYFYVRTYILVRE